MTSRAEFVTHDTLSRIWSAHGLGKVSTIQPAKRGQNNIATIINDRYVIRFDVLDLDEPCRYNGEALAYRELAHANIPAPEVVVLNTTKQLIPYNYIILTKSDGIPLIDLWPNLTVQQQIEAGREAGRILASIHAITLNEEVGGFGRLNVPDTTWRDYINGFFYRHAPSLRDRDFIALALYDRLHRGVEMMQPMLTSVTEKHLVHWDYQFENILYHAGKITAVIDFEWALAGDPVWDFKLVDQWNSDCSGSTTHIIDGYSSIQPLPPDHLPRRWLYKMIWHLDFVDSLLESTDSQSNKLIDYHWERTLAALNELEHYLSL
jgi:aminoglycoside phosphotransferase (APT) family kinase protein